MPFFCRKMNIEELNNIIEPVVTRNKCILWGIEILRGKKRNTLRVFIDSNDNVDINDCESISKDLSYEPSLDMYFGDDYILEVSTPGIDRKFFDINQLKDYIGEELSLKSKEMHEGKRNFTGTLTQCSSEIISIKVKEKVLKFNFNDIDFCRLKPNFNELMKERDYAK